MSSVNKQYNEQVLIEDSMHGDHDAYAHLVNNYKDALYFHAFSIVHDEADANDVTQEVFITAYDKLSSYNPRQKFSTWLFKITTNKAIDRTRKYRREQHVDDEVFDTLAVSQYDAGKHSESVELRDAVARLRPQYRSVISLYYWQDIPISEIAEIVGASQNTVKTWLRRAKDELRKELS